MGLILDISPRSLEKVLYFASFIVLDPGEGTDLVKGQLLTEPEYMEKRDKYPEAGIRVGMGAQAIKELLEAIDLEALAERSAPCTCYPPSGSSRSIPEIRQPS